MPRTITLSNAAEGQYQPLLSRFDEMLGSLRAFKDGWQKPFLNSFPDKVTTNAVVLADGDWAAAFGEVEATHEGEFLGLPGDGEKKTLRYMDFWKLEVGKIIENWVMLDILDFCNKSGVDLLDGNGCEDRGAGYKVASDEKSDD